MFNAIVGFFKGLFANSAIQAFEKWCESVFVAEKAMLLGKLKELAVAAVSEAASTGLDSAQKRDMAFKNISDKAKATGINASSSAISLAIEMAVTAMKNAQTDKK